MEFDPARLANEVLRTALTIAAGLALAYGGLKIYFRQKEYELVKQRYLEQCLDVVGGELEEVTSVLLHNWARALELVKELRDAPQNFETAHLEQGFLPFRGSNFKHAAHHRLRVLTGSQIFWECYQLALSKHMALNAVAAKEIPHAISELLAGRLQNAKSSEIVEAALAELKPMVSKSSEFALLQHAVMQLTAEMEQSRLSFKDIRSFASRRSVQAIVSSLEEKYGPWLRDNEAGNVS
jgi:hypothetical protein